jgi:glucose/arabinose dehydrogenase
MAINPTTGELWCSTNERDGLGDNLPPDFITRVHSGDFFGWPWHYICDHEDPGHAGERPDLRHKITVPDVLLQAHSALLEMASTKVGSFLGSIGVMPSSRRTVRGIVLAKLATKSSA